MDTTPPETEPPTVAGNKRQKQGRTGTFWVFVFGCITGFALLRIPHNPLTTGLDDSWHGVLGYAHFKRWQFGSDLVFTYGPLGYLTNYCIGPGYNWTRILFESVLSFGVGFGLCRLAARMPLFFRVFLPCFFVVASATMREGRDDLFFDTIFITWGLLCCLASGRQLTADAALLTAFAILSALAKFTWVLTGSLTMAFACAGIILQGRRRLAAGVILGYGGCFLALWTLLGQKLSGLPAFVRTSMLISNGWNEAMVKNVLTPRFATLYILFVVGAAAVVVLLRTFRGKLDNPYHAPQRRWLMFFWMAALMFVNWKHGIVREDQPHITPLLVFFAMVALVCEALTFEPGPVLRAARSLQITGALVAAVLFQLFFEQFFQLSLHQTVGALIHNPADLLDPPAYNRECAATLAAEEKRYTLTGVSKILTNAPMDMYGCNQEFALYNHWNFHPRPVFQNYSVYSPGLSAINERFFSSASAPECVTFLTYIVDDRFPPLEDPLILRQLLINYDFAGYAEPMLVLRRARSEAPRLTLLKEGRIKPGASISTVEYGKTNLWLEIELKPGLPGKLAQFFFKLPPPQLQVKTNNLSPAAVYNAPAPMLASGFLASPLIREVRDATNFFTGQPVVRPAEYSVTLRPGHAWLWQDEVHYRIYGIQNQTGRREEP
jgi:hypothetical protein